MQWGYACENSIAFNSNSVIVRPDSFKKNIFKKNDA